MSFWEGLAGHALEGLFQERLGRLYERVTGPWFVAVTWVVLVVLGFWFFQGVDALKKVWPFMTVAVVGAVVLGLGGWWWFSRTRPAIMVAEFLSVPSADDSAKAAAEALRARVLSELHTVSGQRRAFKIEKFPDAVDPFDDRRTDIALAKARESRVAVLVCGRVMIDDGVRSDLRVVTNDRVRDLAESGPSGSPRPWLPHVVDAPGASADQAGAAAAAAQLSLGLAFLTGNRLDDAAAVLEPGTGDPQVQFYAAYAAYLGRDFATAQRCADRSFTLRPWAPAAALASMASRELGLTEQADAYLDAADAAGTEQAGPGLDGRIRTLKTVAKAGQVVELLKSVDQSWQTLAEEGRKLTAWFERQEVLTRARARALDDDWAGVRDALRPLVSNNTTAEETALDARAAAALSAPDWAETIERAERLTAAEDATEHAGSAHEDLAVAYFTQGRLHDADQHWRAFLDGSDTDHQIHARVLAMATFGVDANLGPIAHTCAEFEARTSPDEAAWKARSAAEDGNFEEASAHLARATLMLQAGMTPQHTCTYLELARSYSALGDVDAAAANWEGYLTRLDKFRMNAAIRMADTYLGDTAQSPQVAAVTQRYRPAR